MVLVPENLYMLLRNRVALSHAEVCDPFSFLFAPNLDEQLGRVSEVELAIVLSDDLGVGCLAYFFFLSIDLLSFINICKNFKM